MNLAQLQTRIGYHSVLLGVVGLLASAALATADRLTHADIRSAEQRDLESSLKQVLPAGFADNDLLRDTARFQWPDGSPLLVYRARRGGQPAGAVFEVHSRGYAGDVSALLGVDAGGRVLGVRIVKHAETPGLGDKIEIAKSDWILSFDGKALGQPPLEQWNVKKDGGVFDQFAGATITPRAVVKAVREGMLFYRDHQQEIFNRPTTPAKEG